MSFPRADIYAKVIRPTVALTSCRSPSDYLRARGGSQSTRDGLAEADVLKSMGIFLRRVQWSVLILLGDGWLT